MHIDAKQSEGKTEKPPLQKHDISAEEWRQYEWIDPATGKQVRYRITDAVEVYMYVGSKTHRVVDKDGVAHCVPSVGMYGCVLKWKNKPGIPPVQF